MHPQQAARCLPVLAVPVAVDQVRGIVRLRSWSTKPLTGITLQNGTIDGTNVASTPVSFFGVVNSTVSGITITRANDPNSSGLHGVGQCYVRHEL